MSKNIISNTIKCLGYITLLVVNLGVWHLNLTADYIPILGKIYYTFGITLISLFLILLELYEYYADKEKEKEKYETNL